VIHSGAYSSVDALFPSVVGRVTYTRCPSYCGSPEDFSGFAAALRSQRRQSGHVCKAPSSGISGRTLPISPLLVHTRGERERERPTVKALGYRTVEGARDSVVGRGTMLQAGRARVLFPTR
jgi:hypothetical protein